MFSVALIGPDGSGKTTICRRLRYALPLPVKYIYMGNNPESSNYMLPTTRLIHMIKRTCGVKYVGGPPDLSRARTRPTGGLRRLVKGLKSVLGLANWLSEGFFRCGIAWYYRRRGYIVLLDRHFISDYYAYDFGSKGMERSIAHRIHGFVLDHFYPKPDFMICLDAPAEITFARKGEGTLEALEHLRQEHLKIRCMFGQFAIVDASQPTNDVARHVAKLIWDFYKSKTSNRLKEATYGGRVVNRNSSREA